MFYFLYLHYFNTYTAINNHNLYKYDVFGVLMETSYRFIRFQLDFDTDFALVNKN